MSIKFDIQGRDGQARAGVLRTAHGDIATPSITLNYTKALESWGFVPSDISDARDVILLRNTFWLRERGAEDIREGISWAGPTMADSGGFQMVSLGKHLHQNFSGIGFNLNGKRAFITPHEVVEWGKAAGVDLIMPLDNTVYTMDKNPLKFIWSAFMTAVWHRRSRGIADDRLYYISQGGLNKLARLISLWDARRQLNRGIPAIAIGGLAWNEPRPAMYNTVDFCVKRLPDDKPRHLLGICKPVDILECIKRGIDTFDGIAATREGRHGRVWVSGGKYFDIRNAEFEKDEQVLDPLCDCPTCRSNISRAKLRAGFKQKDHETIRRLMVHNWHHNYSLIKGARAAILSGQLDYYISDYLRNR
ncbi:queuine tRNA-ribosyltransferase family protein [Patescibacteria group bacterium]|nr:queuine tRNA-ribosyltransferase family protein [Patescibacteria group bacterium]